MGSGGGGGVEFALNPALESVHTWKGSEISPYLQANKGGCASLMETGKSHVITHDIAAAPTFCCSPNMTEPGDTSSLKGLQFRRHSEHRDSEYVIIDGKPAYPFVPEEDTLPTNV